MEDKRCVKHCQNGNTEYFSDLYEKYVQKIYSFIFHKTLHKETAEDLTSQTFLKALEKIKTFNADKSQFQTWLYTIARNTTYDYFRTHKTETDIDDIWDLDSGDDLIHNADVRIKYEQLQEKMKVLTAEQREILTLRFWQDLSYKEIAQILGKTEASVKMTTLRSVKKIKKDLLLFLLFPLLLP